MKRQVLQVTDKFTGDVVAEIPQDSRKELREKIHRAYLARDSARSLSFEERIDLVRRVGDRVAQEKEAFISLLVQQAGQARKFAEWEVERTIAQAKHFHELIDLVRPREIPAASGKNFLVREPFGVVAVITPRNTPLVVPFYTIFSALGGGNAVIQKPSNLTPGPTMKLVELILSEGCPADIVQFSTCPGIDAAAEFIENPEVDVFVTYSSSPVGKDSLIKMGSYLSNTKTKEGDLPVIRGKMTKFVPELAGNDPFIVLAGAELKPAIKAAVMGGYGNAGQLCISAKRFIVDRTVADTFRAGLIEAIDQLKVGDPFHPDTDIGPLGRKEALEIAVSHVSRAVEQGGKILAGGKVEAPFFYPTLVEFDKDTVMEQSAKPLLWEEESFAPLRSMVVFDTLQEAIRLANDSHYGLGAAVFGPEDVALDLARRLSAGRVLINESPLYGDIHLPVGGVKDSGLYGSTHKIEEMTYVKRIHLG